MPNTKASSLELASLAQQILVLQDRVNRLEQDQQELQSQFGTVVTATLQENQELKWAAHYRQGDCLSLEDCLECGD